MFSLFSSKKKIKVIEIDESNFNEIVFHSKTPVVLDLYATWCQPCQVMQSLLTRFVKENQEIASHVKICKTDIELNPNITRLFQVQSVPTLLFIHGQKVLERHQGLMTYRELSSKIQDFSQSVGDLEEE